MKTKKVEIYTPKKQVYGRRAYIGNYQGEEFFLMPAKWDCGWYWGGLYLEGLRPYTEEQLRQIQRDQSPEDYGIKLEGTARDYFDEDRWHADLEEDWREAGDVQIEQERNGETYYLCFGTHTHVDSVLLKECKGKYFIAKRKFDGKLFLSEAEFKKLVQIAQDFYALREQAEKAHQNNQKKYVQLCAEIEVVLESYDVFVSTLPMLPPKEFWVSPEVE